jgi:ribonuclease HIII
MIAKTIIKIAQTGVHDSAQLSDLAIKQLGVR